MGVVMLTAKEDLGDKLKAFDLGAQDYLIKPFFMEELKARMYVILKRFSIVFIEVMKLEHWALRGAVLG